MRFFFRQQMPANHQGFSQAGHPGRIKDGVEA
jgi:hypothetical protein